MLEPLQDGRWAVEALLALGGGVFLFARGFGRLRLARAIENTPTCRIRSMPLGAVEISGVAASDEPLEAPLSRKPVAYWEVKVEEYRSNRRGGRWITRHQETSREPFRIDDGTGTVLVIPDGAEVHLPVGLRHESGLLGGGLPPDVVERLDGWGVSRGLFNSRRLRVTERRLDLSGPVYAYAVAQERPDLRRVRAERVNERLRALKGDAERMRAVDLDGDGAISDEEWERVRRAVTDEARAEAIEDRVLIARGERGELFLLSDHDERDLVRRLKWTAGGSVFGGGGLAVGGAAYLLHLFGLL